MTEEEKQALTEKAFKKLGLRIRRASEKFLASVGRNDLIIDQIDFTVADAQQLVGALAFEKAYFAKLAVLFGGAQGEEVSQDMVAAQIRGTNLGVEAAELVFKKSAIGKKKERPA
jgi:hypothetical protein